MFRTDPGACLICGAPHCGCTAGGAGDTIVLLSQRDAAVAAELAATPLVAELPSIAPMAEAVPFTTRSYDRKTHGPKRAR